MAVLAKKKQRWQAVAAGRSKASSAASGPSRADDLLNSYLKLLSKLRLFTPEEEKENAQLLRRAEINTWAAALALPVSIDYVLECEGIDDFSALDALMDNTMEEILTQLPLAEHISIALLHRQGIHGDILNCVLAYERGEWQQVKCGTLSMSQIRDCYLSALQRAQDACQQLLEK